MRMLVGTICSCLLVMGFVRAEDAKKDTDKIKGTWSVVSMERGGDKQPDEVTRDWKLVFEADKLILKVPNGDREAAYTLDFAKKPKHIDVIPKDGDKKDQKLKGIYELDGDNLKLCVADMEQDERPTEFKSLAGSTLAVVVLKRDK